MRAMRAYGDEFVVVSVGAQPEDLTEITINCPDKVGLGCDIARIVFEFGLSITRGGNGKRVISVNADVFLD